MERRDKKQSRYLLANHILDILRTKHFEAGHHLTEQWLAQALSVSRTPIRSALRLLAERGIVEGRQNHGFFLKMASETLDPPHKLEIPSSPEDAFYAKLVGSRLAGEIADSITQTDLTRLFRVNRIVMMRALSRMADEGLITRNKGQGWRFLPSLDTARAMRASYEFRLTIEPTGVALPSFSLDLPALERLKADHDYAYSGAAASMADSVLFELDSRFHETLAGFSGNPYFLQAIQQQNRLRRLLEYQGYGNRRRVRDWVGEHLGVIAALEAGDLFHAADLLRAHLTNAIAAAPSQGEGRGGAADEA